MQRCMRLTKPRVNSSTVACQTVRSRGENSFPKSQLHSWWREKLGGADWQKRQPLPVFSLAARTWEHNYALSSLFNRIQTCCVWWSDYRSVFWAVGRDWRKRKFMSAVLFALYTFVGLSPSQLIVEWAHLVPSFLVEEAWSFQSMRSICATGLP